MKTYNCIVVFDKTKQNILFCKWIKDPYKGLYNFPGGKVEDGESSANAAYRELLEETGISRSDIMLKHFMDLTYYVQDFILELYVGQLSDDVELVEEVNPLVWLPLTNDFSDINAYAGEQNIAHIINIALKCPIEVPKIFRLKKDVRTLGIDGCKDGWIVADSDGTSLNVYRISALDEIVDKIAFDSCAIDMIIGMQSNASDIRPEEAARHILKGRASTIFPAPCRQAVYEESKEKSLQVNQAILGKKFTSQSYALFPKIREVDTFLQKYPVYRNKLYESHPEVSFAGLCGEVLKSSKHTEQGIKDRVEILSRFFSELTYESVIKMAKSLKCNADDITDSVCLVIVANMIEDGKTYTIPAEPDTDETGLKMQLTVPRPD